MPLAWAAAFFFVVALVLAYHDLRVDRDRLRNELDRVTAVAGDRLLDDLIRAGQDVRELIVQERMGDEEARSAARSWVDRALRTLGEQFPAYADEFRVAAGDHESFSGQALVIRTINVKLEVVKQARRGWQPQAVG